jgi:hypothetical protein
MTSSILKATVDSPTALNMLTKSLSANIGTRLALFERSLCTQAHLVVLSTSRHASAQAAPVQGAAQGPPRAGADPNCPAQGLRSSLSAATRFSAQTFTVSAATRIHFQAKSVSIAKKQCTQYITLPFESKQLTDLPPRRPGAPMRRAQVGTDAPASGGARGRLCTRD